MANELPAVLWPMWGKRGLVRSLPSDRDLRGAMREGFPTSVLAELMQGSGLTL